MGWFSTGRGYSSESRIERIDLPEESSKSFKIKTAAAIMLAAVGILAFVWAVNGLLAKEPGWTEIEANNSGEPTCASEFVLHYNAGADGSSPSGQIKALTALYTDVSTEAEKLFSSSVTDDNIHGIGLLNANVNKPVVLDKEAYDALVLLTQAKSRELFLAPVYEQYTTLFFCATDEEAEDFDPLGNEKHRTLLAEMASFAADPKQIDIELNDGNRATLRVSEEYLDYAAKNGIEAFVDLYWMKNAFAADYMAEKMAAAGFTDGYLTCGEGFTRSLGGKDISISSTVYDRVGQTIYKAASLQCGDVKSVVVFHDYPASRQNDRYYYQFADGRMITPYIAVSDGICRSSVSNLTVCSGTQGCAQLMLAVKGAYISDKFSPLKIQKKSEGKFSFAFCRDSCVICSSSEIRVSNLLSDSDVSYSSKTLEAESEK